MEDNQEDFYTIRPVVQLRELRDVVMCCSDELTCTALTNLVERLLDHEDVVFIGNPEVFDKLPVDNCDNMSHNMFDVMFELDHTEQEFRKRMDFESENGNFILMVRQVMVTSLQTDGKVLFSYHYERRDRLGLDGAIRRVLIDELLGEL